EWSGRQLRCLYRNTSSCRSIFRCALQSFGVMARLDARSARNDDPAQRDPRGQSMQLARLDHGHRVLEANRRAREQVVVPGSFAHGVKVDTTFAVAREGQRAT